MTELSPKEKRLLAQLRDVDDPTPHERASADAAVRRMLQMQGLRSLPRLPVLDLPPTAAGPPTAARSGTLKLVWGLGAAVIATLGLFAINAWRAPAGPASAAPASAAQGTPAAPALSVVALPEVATPASAAEPARAAPRASHAPTQQRGSTQPAHSSLAEELRFLSSIDAEIRAGAYERALHRLEQNKSASLLHEERAALRVLAMCGRGHDNQAARARAKFLKASPSSVLAARVRSACPGEPTP
jgi:hypothetical protein